jgi:hypothetical protein
MSKTLVLATNIWGTTFIKYTNPSLKLLNFLHQSLQGKIHSFYSQGANSVGKLLLLIRVI